MLLASKFVELDMQKFFFPFSFNLESSITHELGILTFSMHEVDRYGIATVVERAIESINPRFVLYHKEINCTSVLLRKIMLLKRLISLGTSS